MTDVKTRQRVIDHGEVFTPPGLVNDMLDLVTHECERIDSRFLEPACGDGNFLAEVLRRKLRTVGQKHARNPAKWVRDAILALSSLYGIDLLPDNVAACRERLCAILAKTFAERFRKPLADEARRTAEFIAGKNIVQGDALTLRGADGRPIVFPEWSLVNSSMIKRRDFAFEGLMVHAAYTERGSLCSDCGRPVYLPTPVAEFPPCHYLKLADMEGGHDRA
jgi:hypothetical protein